MKKNIIKRVAVLSLALALCSTALMSGTMAKYTSTVEGEGSTQVAKFEYRVRAGYNDTVAGTSSKVDLEMNDGSAGYMPVELDLFTLREVDTGVNGVDLMAPGTKGAFDITTINYSDVIVDDTFVFTETNIDNVPVVYQFGTGYYSSVLANGDYTAVDGAGNMTAFEIIGDIDDMAMAVSDAQVRLSFDTSSRNYPIKWFWAYELMDGTDSSTIKVYDEKDTAIGYTDDVSVSLKIEATITQLDTDPLAP